MKLKVGRHPKWMKPHNTVTWIQVCKHLRLNGDVLDDATLRKVCAEHRPGDKTRPPEAFVDYLLRLHLLVPA